MVLIIKFAELSTLYSTRADCAPLHKKLRKKMITGLLTLDCKLKFNNVRLRTIWGDGL